MSRQWFVLRVGKNREEKVTERVCARARALGVDGLGRVVVPTERQTRLEEGQRRVVEAKLFPGYAMAEIDTDEAGAVPPAVWHLLRETPGFLGFASPGTPPESMPPTEVEALLRRVDAPQVEPAPTLDLAPGEHVRVIEGSLAGLEGTVEQVQPEKGTVRVLLLVFGRATPVDLEHAKVERV